MQSVPNIVTQVITNVSCLNAFCLPFQLIFLKLSVLLFPSSDYRHPVTTPAFQIMSHVLAAGRFATRNSIASGLFIATLFVEVSLDFEMLAISLVSFVFQN